MFFVFDTLQFRTFIR